MEYMKDTPKQYAGMEKRDLILFPTELLRETTLKYLEI